MHPRREAVPFAFVAETERFRSNVTPPARQRPGVPEIAGRTLIGLTVVAGLVGSLLFGMPALQTGPQTGHTQRAEASEGR
ncbi:hypothetical protein M4914_10900 [Streptomyces somaliensis DSM 40738]|uniref:Uncharacterized protein n=1 Tax=Streptomyces somaliensis (strain ATCC 33201 / DSM 40738 / JCM 12659 / KCTC 9044 / NCTC 11332 / NRRL B-12077 / IP 733) TaxID=1134445 RepID=A0AA44IC42_STRE0|nr:hypothetical protein [Streptomyces somaliensis]MCQ0023406.1 hypothetical protein [Streptomyces somaliensis DSM 40738]NKY13266.1 hypothetical protein [Streptomyces somaliensis DSM 40738]